MFISEHIEAQVKGWYIRVWCDEPMNVPALIRWRELCTKLCLKNQLFTVAFSLTAYNTDKTDI